jgi:hypothetical protein
MRRPSLRALAIGVALAAIPVGAAAPGCGSDAVGVDFCRQIESARCDLAPTCASFAKAGGGNGLPIVQTSDDVARCKEFYRDQCLNGVENATDPTNTPRQDQVNACITALRATANCAAAPTLAGCAGATVAPGVSTAEAPCDVLLYRPENLAACAFVATPADAGVDAPAATDGMDASDAADGD